MGPPARLDQAHATQDEGAHDAFAEVRLRHEQRAQTVRGDDQRLYLAHRVSVDERGASGDLGHLAEELSRALLDEGNAVPQAIAPGQDHAALGEHEQPGARPPRRNQALPIPEAPDLTEALHALTILGVQDREHLRAARLEVLGQARENHDDAQWMGTGHANPQSTGIHLSPRPDTPAWTLPGNPQYGLSGWLTPASYSASSIRTFSGLGSLRASAPPSSFPSVTSPLEWRKSRWKSARFPQGA